MGYQIDADGTIIRPGGEETYKGGKRGGFSKAFLIIGLATLVIALLLWIVLGRGKNGSIVPSRETHHYVGSVGADIHMSLLIDGKTVSGRYYYDSQRNNGNTSSLILRGDKTGNIMKLTEFCDGKTTGWFEGDLTYGGFSGTFTRAKDGALFSFYLVEVQGGTGFFTEKEIAF